MAGPTRSPGQRAWGFVAAIFDQFYLGMAQVLGGQPGMTDYLHVNYHQRTPLNTELKLEEAGQSRRPQNHYAG